MNAVRKRFARWGAGRLAVALAPARTHALIISDVESDDPADIASGPCTPDPNTAQDVIAILQRSGLYDRIAAPMREHLAAVARRTLPETPRAGHPAFAHVRTRIIGSNRLSTEAAARRAAEQSLAVVNHGSVLTGDAARSGATLASSLLERARDGWRGCVIWGGETTVQLGAEHIRRARRARWRELRRSARRTLPGARALGGARPRGGRRRGARHHASRRGHGRTRRTHRCGGRVRRRDRVGGHPRERPLTRAFAGAPRVVRRARRRRRAPPARTHGNKCEGCGDCSARVERPARVFPVALAFRLTQSPRVAHDHPPVHRRHHPGLRVAGHRGDARGERRAHPRSREPRRADHLPQGALQRAVLLQVAEGRALRFRRVDSRARRPT